MEFFNKRTSTQPSIKEMNSKKTWTLVLVIVIILCAVSIYMDVFANSDVTPSTIKRTKNTGTINQTEELYVIDGDWTVANSMLSTNMTSFYTQSGVMPYLYITKEGAYTSQAEVDKFARELYDKIITDEGHFLYVFAPTGDITYYASSIVGVDAAKVMDAEALQIFNDFVIKYADQNKNKRSEIFPMVYKNGVQRIMKKTGWNSNLTIYALLGVAAIIFLVYPYFTKGKKKEKEEVK